MTREKNVDSNYATMPLNTISTGTVGYEDTYNMSEKTK